MQVIFLFLESLGTPEMILIALVALIVFGPRKLPQIGRTIGKYTAEFKRASREFRDTLEREVQMAELEEKQPTAEPIANAAKPSNDFGAVENTIGRSSAKRAVIENENTNEIENQSFALPEVRAMSQTDFAAQSTSNWDDPLESSEETKNVAAPLSKREWL